MRRDREPRIRAPLEQALERELGEIERMTVRTWQLFGMLGVVAGAIIAATLSPSLGLSGGAASAAYVVWFTIVAASHRRSAPSRAMRAVSMTMESAIPWVFLLVLVAAQGAGYALASWVPPMLFCGVMVVQTARLRGRAAFAVGVLGGITYPLLYAIVVRDRLAPELTSQILYQYPLQISRSISLVVAGVLAWRVAGGLRAAFGRAEISVREQDLFGKYRIVRTIARGGMGEVLEALYCPEGGFERRVAIKRIHAHLAEQARFVAAFRTEAELGARLLHPNIVQVLDFGRVADTYFLAMEHVDGMPLSHLLQRLKRRGDRLSPQVVGTIARELLAGLAHAHESARGLDGERLRVVHRDLCPPNVLVSHNGEVKITDFGVARALRDAAASETRTVVGHIGYMAPEQARGEAVGPRADLFPVGVMLWELLALRQLFRRDNEAATLHALLYEPVPAITTLRPDLEPAWDVLIAKAIARDPAERFASAQAMSAALDVIPDAHELHGSAELRNVLASLRADTEVDVAPEMEDGESPAAWDAGRETAPLARRAESDETVVEGAPNAPRFTSTE
ncbi:MAG: serine/threonine protein kinase [Myxococcota bacterium]|nr:serine/threonine protein kinase [Myxococcota bacterium]